MIVRGIINPSLLPIPLTILLRNMTLFKQLRYKGFGVPALAGFAHVPAKAGTPYFLRSLWQNILLVFTAFAACSASAQIQQAWVARYNNGIPGGTNQAVKMALDSNENIYITGFSQNVSGNSGYVTMKYAPNGNQLWASRYDDYAFPSAAPAAMVLD